MSTLSFILTTHAAVASLVLCDFFHHRAFSLLIAAWAVAVSSPNYQKSTLQSGKHTAATTAL
jgi:hypothetical protein